MYTLGINIGHNGSTTLLKDGEIIFHIEEERLTRLKRDAEPFATLFRVKEFTSTVDQLIISGTHQLSPAQWTGEDYYTAVLRKYGITVLQTIDATSIHHEAHAANAFFNSDFDEALVVVIDGAGSAIEFNEEISGFEAETIYKYSYTNDPVVLHQNFITNSPVHHNDTNYSISDRPTIVKVYEGITQHLGWHPIEAGKTMGLAAYGKFDSDLKPLIVNGRGTPDLFKPVYPSTSKLKEEYGLGAGRSEPTIEFTQVEKNLARHLQFSSEKACSALIQKAIDLDPDCKHICISGGYGLNVVNNYKLTKKFPEYTFWFEPTCNDAGNSIGAAKMVYYKQTGNSEAIRGIKDYYLGFNYNSGNKLDLLDALQEVEGLSTSTVTSEDIANLLIDNNIVAIYQGRSEAGPRALGNRSFMYNPIGANSREEMNTVKRREWFRPFAASVLEEHASFWFDMTVDKSPYMMIAFPTQEDKKALIPGVVHADGTTRIQTVGQGDNDPYRRVIEAFYDKTGVPMIMNTSFNLAGEPLVETIEDAIRTLKEADFNYLYIADKELLITKG